MTRGALVLFVGLFSVVFLKKHLGGLKWASLFIVVLGVAVVGLAGALERKPASLPGNDGSDDVKDLRNRTLVVLRDVLIAAKEHTPAETILGMLLIAGAQVFSASQFVIEESIMAKYALDPLVTVGWEGTFGFLITLLGMGILHGAVGMTEAGKGGYFDAREAFSQIFHNRAIAVSSVMIMVSIGYVFLFLSLPSSPSSLLFCCILANAKPQRLQFLRSLGHTHGFRNRAKHHRYLPHPVHLGREFRSWLGIFQMAPGCWVCVARLWNHAF